MEREALVQFLRQRAGPIEITGQGQSFGSRFSCIDAVTNARSRKRSLLRFRQLP